MSRADKARYLMVGGFLGAGKTTAIGKLARMLSDRGAKVGLITNDQSQDLVDTKLLRSQGFPVEEIAGGCFCCRFTSLRDAAERLNDDTSPDVFLAEPVGSCTDLVATVSYPLRRLYGDEFQIAPLSVLVDPIRAARILGLREGRSFSPKVVYVYRKQLEEARFIVLNKCDSIDDELRDSLNAALAKEFPKLSCSRPRPKPVLASRLGSTRCGAPKMSRPRRWLSTTTPTRKGKRSWAGSTRRSCWRVKHLSTPMRC